MAKLKRYDLYEGDDEFISLPGKQPLGRDEGLKARDAYDRKVEEEAQKRRDTRGGGGIPAHLQRDLHRAEGQRREKYPDVFP